MFGSIVQLIGLVLTGTGIGIELALKADFGYVIITLGCIAFAIGTKIKHGGE